MSNVDRVRTVDLLVNNLPIPVDKLFTGSTGHHEDFYIRFKNMDELRNFFDCILQIYDGVKEKNSDS